jgi:hypothetical protein
LRRIGPRNSEARYVQTEALGSYAFQCHCSMFQANPVREALFLRPSSADFHTSGFGRE